MFSASFYGGYPNRGGVLMLSDTLEVSSYTYGVASAKDADATPCQRRTLHRRHIHEILQERICERKPALYLYFTKHDDDNSGEVSLLEWARGMADVLKLETLPWVHLRPMLCPLTASGRVNYSRFLDRYHVKLRADTAWQDEVVQAVSRKLFQAHSTLEQAYATMGACLTVTFSRRLRQPPSCSLQWFFWGVIGVQTPTKTAKSSTQSSWERWRGWTWGCPTRKSTN